MEKNSKQILSDHNVSITNPRILVLEALLENKGPITLDELQKVLKNKVAKSTLYRVLNDLKKIDILDEFTSPENQTVIELILEDRTHHHHLFCSNCGEIIDVELSDQFENFLDLEIKKIEEKFKFKISDHRVEMFGQCTDQCENCKR
ncbi:MAG: transcriptional repressor [Candidatus Actinomarina sp.]|nr:transcriptional repressor [Candidatus Actinomarina sp.]